MLLFRLLFASMVMHSSLRLKIQQISFFMFSVSLGVVLVVASPSTVSVESPTLMLRSCSCDRRKLPTTSHVSAPS